MSALDVLRDDGVGVLSIVFVDVLNRSFNTIHNLDRENEIVVFCLPIFFSCRLHIRANLQTTLTASELNIFLFKCHLDHRQELFSNVLVNQQGLYSIAYRRS